MVTALDTEGDTDVDVDVDGDVSGIDNVVDVSYDAASDVVHRGGLDMVSMGTHEGTPALSDGLGFGLTASARETPLLVNQSCATNESSQLL